MSENKDGPKSLSRRTFLKFGALVGVGIATGIVNPMDILPKSPKVDEQDPAEVGPEDAPKGDESIIGDREGINSPKEVFLTEEELAESHIRIVQAPDVKLHLTKGAFDFSIFRDAREGKIKEAVIVLVPTPVILWQSGGMLTGKERLVLEVAEHTPDEWKELGVALHEIPSKKGFMLKLINPPPVDLEPKSYSQRAQKFWQENPDLHGKVYVFLPVGLKGDTKGKPKVVDSYPSPSQFQENSPELMKKFPGSYRYFRKKETLGTDLRHELSHYSAGGERTSEYEADTGMFNSVAGAWEKYQKTGDASGYPFIFETEEGMIFTKNLQQDSKKEGLV